MKLLKERVIIIGSGLLVFTFCVWIGTSLTNLTNGSVAFESPSTGQELIEVMLDWETECLCGVRLGGNNMVVPGQGYSFTCAKCGRLYAWAWLEPGKDKL